MGVLPPGYCWNVSPDGILQMVGTGITKTRGKDWLPDNNVEITDNCRAKCTGGPCSLPFGCVALNQPPDKTWKPPYGPWPLIPGARKCNVR
jgi:hypothetical protein